ncbi:MAG: hypothetical protein ACFFEF_14250 [Candidatus Thorarchaeota archaeon]
MERISKFWDGVFRSPIPLLTPLFSFLIAIILGIACSFSLVMLMPLQYWDIPNLIIIAVVIGALFSIIEVFIQASRYSNPQNELQDVCDQARKRVFTKNLISLWIRDSRKSYVKEYVSPLHRAIIISPPMIAAIRQHSLEGVIVIAEKLLRADRGNRFYSMLISGVLVTLTLPISYFFLFSLFQILGMLLPYIGIFSILSMAQYFAYPAGAVFLLILLLRGATRESGDAPLHITREFGMHPRLAERMILRDTEMSESDIIESLKKIRKEEEAGRAERRYSISILGGGLIVLLSLVSFIAFGTSIFALASSLVIIYAIFLSGLGGIALIYFHTRRHDLAILNELWKDEELLKEPIWLD